MHGDRPWAAVLPRDTPYSWSFLLVLRFFLDGVPSFSDVSLPASLGLEPSSDSFFFSPSAASSPNISLFSSEAMMMSSITLIRELMGSSEFRMQLLMLNCSKKSCDRVRPHAHERTNKHLTLRR